MNLLRWKLELGNVQNTAFPANIQNKQFELRNHEVQIIIKLISYRLAV